MFQNPNLPETNPDSPTTKTTAATDLLLATVTVTSPLVAVTTDLDAIVTTKTPDPNKTKMTVSRTLITLDPTTDPHLDPASAVNGIVTAASETDFAAAIVTDSAETSQVRHPETDLIARAGAAEEVAEGVAEDEVDSTDSESENSTDIAAATKRESGMIPCSTVVSQRFRRFITIAFHV